MSVFGWFWFVLDSLRRTPPLPPSGNAASVLLVVATEGLQDDGSDVCGRLRRERETGLKVV